MKNSKIFINQMHREFLLHFRELKLIVYPGLFFIIMMVFFPLSMPADIHLLRQILPGLVWIALVLSLMFSAESLFQQDYADGVLEQWLISPVPLSLWVGAKLFVHWLLTLLPIILFCPFIALFFNLSFDETFMLVVSILCGTPAILLLCGLAGIFTTGTQQKGIFITLIVFPLMIPVMIFGSLSLSAMIQGYSGAGQLALLLAISLVAIAFLPFAIAIMLRICLMD